MADLPLSLLPHRVAVETYRGDTATDDTYAPKVSAIECLQEGEISMTADGTYVDAAKLYLRLEHRAKFVRDSRVTLDGGQIGHVRAVADHSDGGLGAWQHLEIVVQ